MHSGGKVSPRGGVGVRGGASGGPPDPPRLDYAHDVPPSCYLNAELAEERFGELARRYAAGLTTEDEQAAAALAALDELESGRELLDNALTNEIDTVPEAPEPLAVLLRDAESPPFEV